MAGLKKDMLFRFLGDSKSLERAAQKAERSIGNVGGSVSAADKAVVGLRKGVAAAAGAFAGVQVGQFLWDAGQAAGDYVESLNAVQVATGDASDDILKLGDNSAEAFGLSRTAVNEAAVAFSAFGEKIDSGDVGGVFEDYLQRAVDFASVMNMDVAEALDKFRSGLAGESEPLRAFGIDVSAAAATQYALKAGLVDSASEMTEAIKVQARYGAIMEQTDKFAGDFANTSDSLANQQKILNAEWENARVELGEKLIPAMTEFVGQANNMLDVMPDVTTNFRSGVEALERWAATTLPNPFGMFGDGWDNAQEAMYQFQQTYGFAMQRLADGVEPTQVAAEWLAHLAGKGVLTDEAMQAVAESTGLTDVGMGNAAKMAMELGDQLGLTAGQVASLGYRTDDYRDAVDRAAVATEEEFAESARELAGQLMSETEPAVEDTEKAVRNLADEMRSLVDPVFKAKREAEKFADILEEVQEDGVVTAEELDRLAEANLDLKAAEEAVTAENIEAYGDAVADVAELVGAKTDDINEAIGGVGGNQNLDTLKDIADRFERMGPITIDLSSLKVATQADIEHAVTDAIYRLQRSGEVVFVPL